MLHLSKKTIVKFLSYTSIFTGIWLLMDTDGREMIKMKQLELMSNIISKQVKLLTEDEFPYDVPDASALKVDFLHRPSDNICQDVQIVALITTSSPNLFQRNMVRQFWSRVRTRFLSVQPVFMLGSPRTNVNETNSKIAEEANQYKDILQGSFIDAYWNLTVKMINGMRWRYKYCKDVPFVLFHDDDVIIDLQPFQSYIENLANLKSVLKCGIRPYYSIKPDHRGKYAVPLSRYNLKYYPTFCSGPCFVMSGDVASKLYLTSRTMVLNIGLTDVTVTGLVRNKSGVEISDDTLMFCKHLETSRYIKEKMRFAAEEELKEFGV